MTARSGRKKGVRKKKQRINRRGKWKKEKKTGVSDRFVLVSQKLQSRDQEDNQELLRSANIMHTQLYTV